MATELLNTDAELTTSLVNLMEVRTVLTKNQHLEQERAAAIEAEIRADINIVVPTAADHLSANQLQKETLLYPLDSLILACAQNHDATLVSFDRELLDAGAVHPNEILDG